MGKEDWRFNPITGTMEPLNPMANKLVSRERDDSVQVVKGPAKAPAAKGSKSIMNDMPSRKPNVSAKEREVRFRERSDLSVVQITDYDTNKVMGYIAGYGLDINFNIEELKSVERVEQFLEGLKKAFRSIILNKALGSE